VFPITTKSRGQPQSTHVIRAPEVRDHRPGNAALHDCAGPDSPRAKPDAFRVRRSIGDGRYPPRDESIRGQEAGSPKRFVAQGIVCDLPVSSGFLSTRLDLRRDRFDRSVGWFGTVRASGGRVVVRKKQKSSRDVPRALSEDWVKRPCCHPGVAMAIPAVPSGTRRLASVASPVSFVSVPAKWGRPAVGWAPQYL
jgi:hypothetical protein